MTLGISVAHLDFRSPVTNTAPSSFFWGIDASLQYGNTNGSGSVDILKTTAGIVDTGTSLLGLTTGKLLHDSDFYPTCVLSQIIYGRRI